MPPIELQRCFTSKINELTGHSPFQGRILRNKPCKKPCSRERWAALLLVLTISAVVFCFWSSNNISQYAAGISIPHVRVMGRKGGRFIV